MFQMIGYISVQDTYSPNLQIAANNTDFRIGDGYIYNVKALELVHGNTCMQIY